MYCFYIQNISVEFDNLQDQSLPFQLSYCISSAEKIFALFFFLLYFIRWKKYLLYFVFLWCVAYTYLHYLFYCHEYCFK